MKTRRCKVKANSSTGIYSGAELGLGAWEWGSAKPFLNYSTERVNFTESIEAPPPDPTFDIKRHRPQ